MKIIIKIGETYKCSGCQKIAFKALKDLTRGENVTKDDVAKIKDGKDIGRFDIGDECNCPNCGKNLNMFKMEKWA